MPHRFTTPFRRWLTPGGLVVVAALAWAKLSMGVRFPDLVMENVPPGTVVNLRQMKGVPYVVINQSDIPLDVLVEPQVPSPGPADTREGYEAVPNPEWLRVVPNRFKLGPGDAGTADVVLSVPDDPALIGRHFQVNIHASTEGTGQLAVGVNHWVRFSVGSRGPAALAKEKNRKTLANLDVELNPPTIRLEKVPLGRKIALRDFKGVSLKVVNKGNDPVKLSLASRKVDNNLREPGWTDPPDPAWLTVKPDTAKVKPNQIKEGQLFLEIPDKPEHRNQKYMFMIKAELADLGIPLQFYTRVYVTTE